MNSKDADPKDFVYIELLDLSAHSFTGVLLHVHYNQSIANKIRKLIAHIINTKPLRHMTSSLKCTRTEL